MSFRVWSRYVSYYVVSAMRTLNMKVKIESDGFRGFPLGNID